MSNDKLDFLEETQAEDTKAVEEPTEVEEVEAEAEATEAEPEAETGAEEPEVPPTPEAEKEKQAVPVMALLDEREKRQAAERKAEEFALKLQALEQRMKQAEQPQQQPDYWDNPQQAVQQQLNTVKLQQSKFLAEREFGADLVAQAYAYFDEHPQESQQLLNHPSPFHAAVEVYKQKQFLQEVGADPESWKAQQLEALREQIMAEVQTPVQPKAPPPSMARAPRAGGEGSAPGNAFDQVFS